MPALLNQAMDESPADLNAATAANDNSKVKDVKSTQSPENQSALQKQLLMDAPTSVAGDAETKAVSAPVSAPGSIQEAKQDSPGIIYQSPKAATQPETPEQSAAPAPIASEKPPVKESKDSQKSTSTPVAKDSPKQKSQPASEKCTTDNDCQKDQFCVVKGGMCMKKFDLDAEGCANHEQCSGEGVACVQQGKVRRCLKACKTSTTLEDCGEYAHCSADKSAIKGLRGGFDGICKSGNPSINGKELISATKAKSGSSSLFVPLTIVIGALIGLVLGFLWLRSWSKRRNINGDPQKFLFKQSQSSLPGERLDSKLLKMGGTHYTVWAPLE